MRKLKRIKQRNLGAEILFSEAKARIDSIFQLVEEYNEIVGALRDIGYGCDMSAFDDDGGALPLSEICVDAMNYRIDDSSFLDEILSEGPIERREPREFKRVPLGREKRRLGEESGWKCFYCEREGTPEIGPDLRVWHVDHVYPVCRGGDDLPDNHVLACATCNLEKRARTAREYYRAQKPAEVIA
jgi:hypothetical protein